MKGEDFIYDGKEDNLLRIADGNNLTYSFFQARKGTDWKESVQRYEMNFLYNTYQIQNEIMSGKYKEKPLHEFPLDERGHKRLIKSHNIRDRVVQRSLCDNVLMKEVHDKLIYDNGASVKNKGITFSRQRFENHVREAYKKFNGNAYILFIDYSKYFDNLQHEVIIRQFSEILQPVEVNFLIDRLKKYEVDVSYMSEEEYKICLGEVFNSLEYNDVVSDSLRTGEKLMKKSVGIGSQMSQVSGIFYTHRIDNFCKYVLSLRYYGRYMDDSYIILDNKYKLEMIADVLCDKCKEIGITVNKKKTNIININDSFTYLKINYFFKINSKGDVKLIRKVHHDTLARERRRLRKFKNLMSLHKMTREQIFNCYIGWRGTYKKFDSGYDIQKMDMYLYELFNITKEDIKNGKLKSN